MILRVGFCAAFIALTAGCAGIQGGTRPDMIVVRTSSKTPDQVVDAIKSHAAAMKWAFLGANKVKNGEITMVKVCIPQVGAALWEVDMKLTALLPCGNVSIYTKAGQTQVAMLSPSYMSVLHPSPESEKAVGLATPQLEKMLEVAVN